MNAHVPVVIVGAGPTGVTAATILGQYGVGCVVLDRWADVYPQPRAVHLDDEVLRILAGLGLADGFRAISRPGLGLRLLDPRHRVLAEFQRVGASSAHGFPRASMFDQPELERLLRANVERFGSVTMRAGVEVEAVTASGPDRVRVDFTDHETGQSESVLAQYVLGCDGANSVVRSSIGSSMVDLGFEQRWLVVDVSTNIELGQWEGVHQVCDPVRAATYMRIGDTRYRWEFRLKPDETSADFDTVQALAPLIRPWTDGIDVDDLELVRVAEYTFRAQIADRWRAGNVFLLGDAAHLTPPFVGQGMGAGLRDAANLAWKVAGVLGGALSQDDLDSYEQERKPHARSMIRLAKLMGALMTEGGSTGNVLRRILAPRLTLVPGLRTKILDSETPALRRSRLVSGPGRLAGKLCPNALMPDGRRLDEHAPGQFLMVADGPISEATSRGAYVVTAAEGTELLSWLRRHRVRLAVVRPDRTVMRAGNNVTAGH